MTMRSKQWYTETIRLSNSFAKNSIGRFLSRLCCRNRSSARRPVESSSRLLAEKEERVSKGKETVGFVPFGGRRGGCRLADGWHSGGQRARAVAEPTVIRSFLGAHDFARDNSGRARGKRLGRTISRQDTMAPNLRWSAAGGDIQR